MPRLLPITSYLVRFATCAQGFNEWRQNIDIRTEDPTTSCDVRFVDEPSALPPEWEFVNETGWSKVYLPSGEFSRLLEVLRTEKPLYLVLYQEAKRAMIQSGPEPPGEDEPTKVPGSIGRIGGAGGAEVRGSARGRTPRSG